MGIRVRLAVFVFGVMTILLVLMSYANHIESNSYAKLEKIMADANNLVVSVEKLDGNFQKQLLAWSNLLLRGEEPDEYYRYLKFFYKQERDTRSEIVELEKQLEGYSVAQEEMRRLYEEHSQLGISYRRALKVYNQSDDPIYETDRTIAKVVDAPLKTLESVKKSIIKHKEDNVFKAEKEIKENRDLVFIILFISMSVFIAVFLWMIDSSIGRPIDRIIRAASDVYKGNVGSRIDEDLPGEFNIFAQAFNQMTNKLVQSNDDLKDNMNTLKQEISRRETLEQELEKKRIAAEDASRAKTEFLSTMSHEIRTPLNVVIGYSDLLLTSEINERQKRYIDSIHAGGESLLSIINDVLDLAKIEANKMAIEKEEFNLHSLIKQIKLMFDKQITDKGLFFNVVLAEDVPNNIVFDEHRLKQIIVNLLSNAIKFTDKGGISLGVSVLQSKESSVDLSFEIKDSGLGIPEEYHKKVFNSFEQKDGQDARKYGGTGLGLSISQKLTQLLGGDISLNSALGEGSLFTLSFYDISTGGLYGDRNAVDPLSAPELNNFPESKILIADDISANRVLLMNFLEGHPIEFIEAENGLQAIEMATRHKPDLILMDIKMPEMDGVEATKHIKNDDNLKNIPIIAVTASSIKAGEMEERNMLFDDYLTKPLKLSVLMDSLKQYLL